MHISKVEEKSYETFEFIEFRVGINRLGISITQVREIIEPVEVTPIPHSHPYIKGIIQLRGEVLPVVNLKKMTGYSDSDNEDPKYIVAEFNGRTMVLEVSAVTQIERINFTEIESSSEIYEGEKVPVSGVIKRDYGIILLVDFEKVMIEEFGQ